MGAGRTELLKCIFGAVKAKSGEFYLNGKPYVPKSPVTALKNRIALISEDRKREGLILSMSITDNMLFPNLANFSLGPVIRKAQFRIVAYDVSTRIAEIDLPVPIAACC